MNNTDPILHLQDLMVLIDDDIVLPLNAHEKENRGGYLGISRQVFCLIDYLGAFTANGDTLTDNAIAFMDDYLVPKCPVYSGKTRALYCMWRHGLVHEYDPKVFKSEKDNYRLAWGANNSSSESCRKWHLACLCKAGQPGSYRWWINLFQLVDDLRVAVTYVMECAKNDSTLCEKFAKNLTKISRQKDLDASQNKSLIHEVQRVIAVTAGVLDDTNIVVQSFANDREFHDFRDNEWHK